MKVNFDLRNKQNTNKNVSFEGFVTGKNNYGEKYYEFNYPHDRNQYDCYLEICAVGKDTQGNYYVLRNLPYLKNDNGYCKLEPNGNKFNMQADFNLQKGEDFAYHYALVPKGADRNDPNTKPTYKLDAGDVIDSRRNNGGHEVYNIVTTNGAFSVNSGAMKLLMPDFYNPIWTYDKNGKIVPNPEYGKDVQNSVKSFSNKIGGNLAGIEKDVRDGKFDGYTRIISTPIFTDDDVSSHGYWNKNCMQMVQSIGNINNYASLQREMFKKGLNFVSDGAFVNEGLEGIHFKHVLKWGEKSPYFKWFNAENLKNGPMTLGVFSRNTDFISHKLVNPKYIYTQDPSSGKIKTSENKAYNKNKPTYLQIYDNRLASEKQQKDNKNLIKSYDIITPKNPLEINDHNDTIIPYSFEINPETYNENIKNLNKFNDSMRSSSPKNIDDAFEFATDIVFPRNVNLDKNEEVKEIFSKAIADVELSKPDAKYQTKVNSIIELAENAFGLRITDEERKKLSDSLSKMKNTVRVDSYMGTKFLSKFENFELDEKQVESKVDTWDANTDIPKLKYLYSKADSERIKLNFDPETQETERRTSIRKTYEVQDYAIASGSYWTGKTHDILNTYVAKQLTGINAQNPQKAYQQILNNIETGKFPKKLKNEINADIVKNVLSNDYEFQPINAPFEYKDFLLAGLMELPLDSIEFGDNLTTVLASPYISKRATKEEQLGTSRYDMYIQKNPHLLPEYEIAYKKMDKVYTNELSNFAAEIIDNLNSTLPEDVNIYSGYNTTPYGKYVLPHIAETITKFAIVKALAPKTEVKFDENGELTYDYNAMKNVTLETLGIYASSPEDEARQVISKIQTGIKQISVEDKKLLTQSIFKTLKGTNESSFKLAEVIIDRLNAGLDWRIDATKDIGDINALKNREDRLDNIWPDVTKFWKHFAHAVYEQNRNSYIVAEITNEDAMFQATETKKYKSPQEVVKKFVRETDMKAVANYSFYFSSILNLYGKHFDRFDKEGSDGYDSKLSSRINNKSTSFFQNMPYDAIVNSYNFIGNHDKPRALHGLVVDTDWYSTNLNDKENFYYREKAIRNLNGNYIGEHFIEKNGTKTTIPEDQVRAFVDSYHLENASKKAIAMTETLQKGFERAIANKYPHDSNKVVNESVTRAIYQSLGDLANGRYKGKQVQADGFGVKPVDVAIDIIIDQAKSVRGLDLPEKDVEELKVKTLEAVLKPAFSKVYAMMDVLSVMPGMPTLYAGDDLGATGYESETKNIYLQNRGYIHREWLDPKHKEYKFIQDHYKKMNSYMKLRDRKELQALNDGAPYVLYDQSGTVNGRHIGVSTILRQGTDGSMALSLINTSNINHIFNGEYQPGSIKMERIHLKNDGDNSAQTLSKGLTPGTVFTNAADKNDKYVVREYNGNLFIKRMDASGKPEKDQDIYINGTTLTLYAEAPKSEKKNGNGGQIPFGSAYKMISRYDSTKIGEKLSLVSR